MTNEELNTALYSGAKKQEKSNQSYLHKVRR